MLVPVNLIQSIPELFRSFSFDLCHIYRVVGIHIPAKFIGHNDQIVRSVNSVLGKASV